MWRMCTLKTTKHFLKKLDTNKWKNIHVHLLEDLKLSTYLTQSPSKPKVLLAEMEKSILRFIRNFNEPQIVKISTTQQQRQNQ